MGTLNQKQIENMKRCEDAALRRKAEINEMMDLLTPEKQAELREKVLYLAYWPPKGLVKTAEPVSAFWLKIANEEVVVVDAGDFRVVAVL